MESTWSRRDNHLDCKVHILWPRQDKLQVLLIRLHTLSVLSCLPLHRLLNILTKASIVTIQDIF